MDTPLRILHLTHNPQWFFDHFAHVCDQTGHTGYSVQIPDYSITKETANELWEKNKDYYNSFDAVFISHLATLSRIFLQNDWQKPLYIWLCFRFDYFHPPRVDKEYQQLIAAARHRPNVKFFAATIHDKLYIQNVLGDFPVEVVEPFIYINNAVKQFAPCKDKYYLFSKHNETVAMNLKQLTDALGIPTYQHAWDLGEPDLRGVRGIIHLPYNNMSRGFLENLALENVFFLPTLDFLKECIATRRFWWDIERIPQHVELSEWYAEENKNLFVYFSSFEDLKRVTLAPDVDKLIESKKITIRLFNEWRNAKTLEKWSRIFS